MLRRMQVTHFQIKERKGELSEYTSALAKAEDKAFFDDSSKGLEYLTKMQTLLNNFSVKACTQIDEVSDNPSQYVKLSRLQILVNALSTTILSDVTRLLAVIPNDTTYQSARDELIKWQETIALLKENLALVKVSITTVKEEKPVIQCTLS